jgi:TonB family protein
LIRKVDPQYTAEARRAKITGDVWLDAVINSDGTVEVRGVKKSLDATFGLDQAAIAAAKQWLFKPGQKDGKPVPIHVMLIMEFRLPSSADEVHLPGAPITNPVLKSKVDPKYTREAMQAKIQGEVWIDAIVETDGTVQIATIKKSLDTQYGLDNAALDAARQWTFAPGTLDGKPVRVRTMLVLEFRLH